MTESHSSTLIGVAQKFDITGRVSDVQKYGNGHINRTYLVTTDKKRYILQKINADVFPNVENLMSNIVAVTNHLRSRGENTLTLVPTVDGDCYLRDGGYRMYEYIENTVALQAARDENTLTVCGNAFGRFVNALSDFDASSLHETIPFFHDTPRRFGAFCAAIENDKSRRAHTCAPEIKFINSTGDTLDKIIKGLADGSLPLRVTHNDTKLNNILFDSVTGDARAVIDLDTVMSGSMLYDFGDAIRFAANKASEDEKDAKKAKLDTKLFTAYAQGYLNAVKNSVTDKEIELMPYSAYLMTLECGIRFLTDYLDGDVYFATQYPEHNLVRCRTQLKLAHDIMSNASTLQNIIYSII